nr:phage regulatory CII family protein [uncultured Roseococcus sp.]
MNARRDVPQTMRALKTLFRALVDRVGGCEAAAACARPGRSQIASYYDMTSEAFAPIDVISDLEAAAQEPLVTSELARRQGYVLVPVEPQGNGELPASMAAFGREVSEVFSTYADAMADGKLCDAEREDLERQLLDVVRVAQGSVAVLRRQRGASA